MKVAPQARTGLSGCYLRFADIAIDQRLPLFPRFIAVGKFDSLGNGAVRRLEDEEESVPIGRIIAPLNIPNEHYRRRVILMSQFKAEAVGFVLDMAMDKIESRHKGKPEEGQEEQNQRQGRRVGKFAEPPAPGEPVDGGAAQPVGEPESGQQKSSDDRQLLPGVAHDVVPQFVANSE